MPRFGFFNSHSAAQLACQGNGKSSQALPLTSENAKQLLLTGENRENRVRKFISVISVTSRKKIYFCPSLALAPFAPLREIFRNFGWISAAAGSLIHSMAG
jgi:hypothetical protein